ncbi:hypothetical protein XELAEV_18032066mg [Xenopus laevis]|uniref:Uncharacterized protein n=1 Tax=Xenopus laevis TaxID=8355 RepID=A0A974HGD3_XENLA|nr:hypothetical protein XELAEV_18032066mg [Xenopus laevis]
MMQQISEICKYILCKDRVSIPNTQKVYTILDYYLCASSNVVFMITCTRCSTGGIYIGFLKIGETLLQSNHSLQHMQVLILKGNFKTERERTIYELKCIELFNTLKQGLNLGSGFMSHCVT